MRPLPTPVGHWLDWADEALLHTRLVVLCFEALERERLDLPDRYTRRLAYEESHGHPGITYELRDDGGIDARTGGEPLVSVQPQLVAAMRRREHVTITLADLCAAPDDARDIEPA